MKKTFTIRAEAVARLSEGSHMKRRSFRLALVALSFAFLLTAQSVFAHGTQKYINGLWFNGQTFEQRTVFVVELNPKNVNAIEVLKKLE